MDVLVHPLKFQDMSGRFKSAAWFLVKVRYSVGISGQYLCNDQRPSTFRLCFVEFPVCLGELFMKTLSDVTKSLWKMSMTVFLIRSIARNSLGSFRVAS